MENKRGFIILIIVFTILSVLALYFSYELENSRKVCFGDSCVDVEIADTSEKRTNGLMFRTELAKDRGMLFVFPESDKQSFWMKNTLLHLDIIWINESFEVVDFISATPCSFDPCLIYVPEQNARYVLEVNKGFVEENNISLGDKASFSL